MFVEAPDLSNAGYCSSDVEWFREGFLGGKCGEHR